MSEPGIAVILREVYDGEEALERQLHIVAEVHRADHEVRHVAVDLARWSLQNRRALAPLADTYGGALRADQDPEIPSPAVATLREKTADLVGQRSAPGMLLLHDLREVYLMASGNSVHWTMLGQAAQTTHDSDLLEVVAGCHGRTMRQFVWCNSMIKVLSTQVLTAL